MCIPPEYATSSTYVFHKTPRENAEDIQAEGVRQDVERNVDSTDILAVLDELGYEDPFPFHREAVTYCHIDDEFVANTLQPHSEADLASPDVAIVVDSRKIEATMYLANMGILTDLLDYRYAGAEQMIHGDTPEEVVELYTESIQEVHTPADIDSYTVEKGYPELVIDGDIPVRAVKNVIDPQSKLVE